MKRAAVKKNGGRNKKVMRIKATHYGKYIQMLIGFVC
jgi:hypothetical protein